MKLHYFLDVQRINLNEARYKNSVIHSLPFENKEKFHFYFIWWIHEQYIIYKYLLFCLISQQFSFLLVDGRDNCYTYN